MLFPFKTKPKLNLDLSEVTMTLVGDEVIGQLEIPTFGFLTVNESIAQSQDWTYLKSQGKTPTCRAEQILHESYIFVKCRLELHELTREQYIEQFPYALMEKIHAVYEHELKADGTVYQLPDGSEVTADFLSGPGDGQISTGSVEPSSQEKLLLTDTISDLPPSA